MKKLLVVVFIACSLSIIFSEEKPIDGYGSLPWGSTISQVKEQYQSLVETDDELNDLGKQSFRAKPVDGTGRVFEFFNGCLYAVTVSYDDIDRNTGFAILDKITAAYGMYTTKESRSAMNGDKAIKGSLLTILYSDQTVVRITYFDIIDASGGYVITSGIWCRYFNPRVNDQVNDAEIKSKSEKISL